MGGSFSLFFPRFRASFNFPSSLDLQRNGMVMIQDLDGFGWKHFDLKFQKKFMSTFQVFIDS